MAKNVVQRDSNSTGVDEKMKIHNFSATVLENVIHFHVLKMRSSLFIWIGKKPELAHLSVAMCTKYETIPAVTSLMGEISEATSSTLAQKLAKKSKKQCFVSCNLPPESTLLELVEKRLIKEMNDQPDQF